MDELTKYILLQNNFSLSYTCTSTGTKDKIFVNNIEKEKDNGDSYSLEEIEKLLEDYKATFYNSFLKKHYKNLVILTAAGTSLDNGINSGKTREGLWNDCRPEIKSIYRELLPWNEKIKSIARNKDLEALLSHIFLIEKIDDVRKTKLKPLREALQNKIKTDCTLDLDEDQAPHKDFLNKITARKSNDARIQLFTTNYDTLFEQAANKAGFVIIDGFSFTHPREFAGKWFDLDIVNREKTRLKQEESFVSKVFHLYKLHGSLNWTKEKGRIVQKDDADNPLIIYPASEKYESSYEQPYFEMMSRFQQALRKEETLLIVIGFGFQDKHIKNVIVEAVEQNPSFQLLIVNYNGNGSISAENLDEFFTDKVNLKVKRNVNIIFERFKDFVEKYPENQTYYLKENEPI
ncbi:SIR2 family protein [Porphyromonadaceae sp. NP-X]|jgi:NAD-dependent SIR2 family protein deacetylase|nr:SIR2 family protein [Paludibacteraceae bacterium]MDS1032778.1 SIR2 family protein [Porphyromonadaceae sp. NP-X]